MSPQRSTSSPRESALQTYRQTIINAQREVNDALINTKKSTETFEALSGRVDALREFSRLSTLRFENGAASYLEVLYANEQLFDAELTSVQAQTATFNSLIDVYKSMGGRWVDEAVSMAPTPEEVVSKN